MFHASSFLRGKTAWQSLSVRSAVAATLIASTGAWSGSLQGATNTREAGVQMLRAELPSGANIAQSDCALLSRAVGRATVAHRAEAAAILSAALTGGVARETLRGEQLRSCECVGQIVRACVLAAPARVSAVLDVAVSLYPDCSDALAAVVTAAERETASANAIDEPVAGISNVTTPASPNASGFGAGFGPGSPGSPGFSGSAPSGGFALPTPSGAAVTSVVNS